ncbi:MAG: DMT family transporter [Bacteroidales bacterium]|nr:DMT family transporter [Candidatus Liminaster caballi]
MRLQGYLFAALAAATYGTNPLFAKPLYAAGMNPDSVLLFRYVIAIVMMMLLIGWKSWRRKVNLRDTLTVKRHSLPQLIIMGLLMSASSILLFVSYNYMPVGIASTLLFVYPILVAVIMALCFGERLSWIVLGCLLTATAGVALLCRTDSSDTAAQQSFWIGFLCVMASSLAYAIYLVGLNKTRVRTIATLPVTFYVLLFGSLIYVVRLGCGIVPLVMPHGTMMWLCCLGLGLFPTVISLVMTSRAIQCIGSTQTALLGALEPVTAVTLGIAFLGESICLREAIGMVLIFAAVTLVVGKAKG